MYIKDIILFLSASEVFGKPTCVHGSNAHHVVLESDVGRENKGVNRNAKEDIKQHGRD
jgi:hypothetical protein